MSQTPTNKTSYKLRTLNDELRSFHDIMASDISLTRDAFAVTVCEGAQRFRSANIAFYKLGAFGENVPTVIATHEDRRFSGFNIILDVDALRRGCADKDALRWINELDCGTQWLSALIYGEKFRLVVTPNLWRAAEVVLQSPLCMRAVRQRLIPMAFNGDVVSWCEGSNDRFAIVHLPKKAHPTDPTHLSWLSIRGGAVDIYGFHEEFSEGDDNCLSTHVYCAIATLLERWLPERLIHVCAVCNETATAVEMASRWIAHADVRGTSTYYRSGICGHCQAQLSLYQMALLRGNTHFTVDPTPEIAEPVTVAAAGLDGTSKRTSKRARTLTDPAD